MPCCKASVRAAMVAVYSSLWPCRQWIRRVGSRLQTTAVTSQIAVLAVDTAPCPVLPFPLASGLLSLWRLLSLKFSSRRDGMVASGKVSKLSYTAADSVSPPLWAGLWKWGLSSARSWWKQEAAACPISSIPHQLSMDGSGLAVGIYVFL